MLLSYRCIKVTTLLFVIFLAGCASATEKDFLEYQNKGMHPLKVLEDKRRASTDSVFGKNFHGDGAARDELIRVAIPIQEEIVATTRTIHPRTTEVKELQQLQLRYDEAILENLKCRVALYERRDPSAPNRYRAANQSVKESLAELKANRTRLMAKYHISFDSK